VHICDPVLTSDSNVRVQYSWDVYGAVVGNGEVLQLFAPPCILLILDLLLILIVALLA